MTLITTLTLTICEPQSVVEDTTIRALELPHPTSDLATLCTVRLSATKHIIRHVTGLGWGGIGCSRPR